MVAFLIVHRPCRKDVLSASKMHIIKNSRYKNACRSRMLQNIVIKTRSGHKRSQYLHYTRAVRYMFYGFFPIQW